MKALTLEHERILRLLAGGAFVKEIAGALGCSESKVEYHFRVIAARLDYPDTGDLSARDICLCHAFGEYRNERQRKAG